MIFADVSQNWLSPVPIHYIVIQYPNRWYKWPFVTCHIHLTNRSPMFLSMFLSSHCGEFWLLPQRCGVLVTYLLSCLMSNIRKAHVACHYFVPACFCHPTVGNFGVSLNSMNIMKPNLVSSDGLLLVVPIEAFSDFHQQWKIYLSLACDHFIDREGTFWPDDFILEFHGADQSSIVNLTGPKKVPIIKWVRNRG